MEHLGTGIGVELKGEIDPVTELDRRTEDFLVKGLSAEFPGHEFLAEEQTNTLGDSEFRWIIDPLDGTTNYAHGYPCFTVSIGLQFQRRTVLGVVYQPATREMFTAVEGGGAQLNGRRISVSGAAAEIERAFLVTGFPYNLRRPGVLQRNLGRFEKLLAACFAVRRDGSAAYDLACVAAGRFHGYWEENLNPWDTVAGTLLVREAGGEVTDFEGNAFDPLLDKAILAAGNRALLEQMLILLK
ncbi:MAG: hypothetical protein A3F83_02595 [Candidatus Glassbacteria bacterium RIFCSPLOWO2_12_FULL_58_11]|uniref:Inositol-1-monophosphatase n=1 Tax=Candidatus Glassbacteria bacterium RIFCSPLOWO2_12_FULL_58_11 TaxID=1817867 RepID=A0A1F5YTY3_9BACT|nr:MAG: hypothetical protein A3F83_02595 [Candidatus Glassbacteria bacterium RIFCSPLOWO2_12_FULL_58_11]